MVNPIARLKRRLHCPHSNLDPIYGDEIRFVGYYRLQCLDCYAFIDGPVTLAAMRKPELSKPENEVS